MTESLDRQNAAAPSASRKSEKRVDRIFLVPYPKIVFLYPAFITSIVAAVYLTATGRQSVGPDDTSAVMITWVFLGILGVNLIVMAFDFPRATSLTMVFLVAAIVLGAILAVTLRPQLLPAIADLVQHVRPVANAMFFNVIVVLLSLIYVAVFVSVQFDYWEVRPNELLHHHGILSDLKRYAAPNLRIDKEINDVFEYVLLGSGRLILQPSGERRAVILDNVLFISKKERAITGMLSALQVEVRSESR